MFSYYLDTDGYYYVIDGDGMIYAQFGAEWEAADYCNRHNSKALNEAR